MFPLLVIVILILTSILIVIQWVGYSYRHSMSRLIYSVRISLLRKRCILWFQLPLSFYCDIYHFVALVSFVVFFSDQGQNFFREFLMRQIVIKNRNSDENSSYQAICTNPIPPTDSEGNVDFPPIESYRIFRPYRTFLAY